MRKINVKSILGGYIAFSLLLIGLPDRAAIQPLASAQASTLQLNATSDESLLLELVVSDVSVQQVNQDNLVCQSLQVDGLSATGEAGQPELPGRAALIGIPSGVEPQVTLLEANLVSLPGSYDLCPAARPDYETTLDGMPVYHGERLIKDAAAYSQPGFAPAQAVELESTGFIRSQRVARLNFTPFQYDPSTGMVRYYDRLLVQVDFPGVQAVSNPLSSTQDEGRFEPLLRETLLNYAQARSWRISPKPIAAPEQIEQPSIDLPHRILTKGAGLYQVSYTELKNVGASVDSLDPRTFKLSNQGSEVAIQVTGEQDGVFNNGDVILFYAEKIQSKYTELNAYQLTWGGANGKRMAQVDGSLSGTPAVPASFKTTDHAEDDLIYQSTRPSGANNDHWYWVGIQNPPPTGGVPYAEFKVNLKNISTSASVATLRGLLRSFSASPQHHTKIFLNGNLVSDTKWQSGQSFSFDTTASHSFVIEGENTWRVELINDSGITQQTVFVNWLEADYYDTYTAENDQLKFDGDVSGVYEFRVSGFSNNLIDSYDITNPREPKQIINATVQNVSGSYQLRFKNTVSGEAHYLAQTPTQRTSVFDLQGDWSANLSDPNNQADYLIITHPDFGVQADALANYRQGQGYSVKVVSATDIYDEFNHGIYDPEAIRDFLAYTYTSWKQPAPQFVLLFGDGNYDFKNDLGRNEIVYIPPYLADVDPWLGETAADNRYVTVSGNDILPDMFLGRLAVKTPAEAQAVVDKILAYEADENPASWSKKITFVADNADSGGEFPDLANEVADNYVPSPYSKDKIYHLVTHPNTTATHDAIMTALNQGRLLVSFTGHGSAQWWAAEKLLQKNDIPAINNAGKLAFFVPMTCLEGYFITPSIVGGDQSSFAESVVREATDGAIASWSPTGLRVATGHDVLETGLFKAIFYHGKARLGPATNEAKYYLFSNLLGHDELLDTFILLGDPALHLAGVVEGQAVYLPLIRGK